MLENGELSPDVPHVLLLALEFLIRLGDLALHERMNTVR